MADRNRRRGGGPSGLLARPSGRDVRAGVVLGLVSVPDGLAAGLLAGLNPVAGLYGYLFGTLAGALTTSSVVMSVQATGAMAAIIADLPGLSSGPDAASPVATLTVMTGLVMLGAGLAGLGSLVRYVPNAVLGGFVNAVAINIMLGQLSAVTGYDGQGSHRLERTLDTLLHVTSFHWPTFVIAAATLLLIVVLERTRLGALGLFVAVVLTSALVALVDAFDTVPVLGDIVEVPRGLPLPVLPSLGAVADLLIPAFSLALVGLVQGAAIGQSVPNPDGTYADTSGDFRGQGIANLASGLLRGMPVGGSMSATSLVLAAGGQGRHANLIAGLVMALVVVGLGPVAGLIAMPALAALLMLVGFRTLKPDQVRMVARTGRTQTAVIATTFVLTLLVPLHYAVVVGVGISIILFVAGQSNRVTIRQWVFEPGSPYPTETSPPATLPSGEIVVLTPYGSLFFASASVFEARLPGPGADADGSVVVLRLRGKEDLGSTFINTIVRYHEALRRAGGHLVLAGVGERVLGQLTDTEAIRILGAANVFPATARLGESLEAGLRRARELQGAASGPSSDSEPPPGTDAPEPGTERGEP